MGMEVFSGLNSEGVWMWTLSLGTKPKEKGTIRVIGFRIRP